MLRYKSTIASVVATVAWALTGCSSYNPSDHYDADALEVSGRIVGKRIAYTEEREWQNNHAKVLLIPIGGTFIPFYFDYIPGKGTINIYEYQVSLADGDDVHVLSEFPAHEAGECVKVFLSKKSTYPRLTSGGDCLPNTGRDGT